jgi:hypothetical protein
VPRQRSTLQRKESKSIPIRIVRHMSSRPPPLGVAACGRYELPLCDVTEQGFEGCDSVAAFLVILLDLFEDNQFTHAATRSSRALTYRES